MLLHLEVPTADRVYSRRANNLPDKFYFGNADPLDPKEIEFELIGVPRKQRRLPSGLSFKGLVNNPTMPDAPATLPVISQTQVGFVEIYLCKKIYHSFDEKFRANPITIYGRESGNHSSFYKENKYYDSNVSLPRDSYNETRKHEHLKIHIERTRCSVHGCLRYTTVRCISTSPPTYYSAPTCNVHGGSQPEVKVGETYKSHLPKNLVEHVDKILKDPDGQGLREEAAIAKALAARVLKSLSETAEGFDSITNAAASLKILGLVADLSGKAAEVSAKLDNSLTHKQVLVLLSAATEFMIKYFGRTDDARFVLLNMLPELPWPSGVARVSGVEGLIGQKGQLLLPAKPENKQHEITADFPGLTELANQPCTPTLGTQSSEAVPMPDARFDGFAAAPEAAFPRRREDVA